MSRPLPRTRSPKSRRPRKPVSLAFRPRLEVFEERCLPSVFTVTNTDDSGPGSLRQAILDANANPGANRIIFHINTGVQVIQPNTALPIVSNPVVIDGTTQSGFSGTPLIVLDGLATLGGADGLTITAGNSTVRGLAFQRFSNGNSALVLRTAGGNLVAGNYFGTAPDGVTRVENSFGISVSNGSNGNTIGGTSAQDRNLISGNGSGAVMISTNGNTILGNYVGTDFRGAMGIRNQVGITLAAGASDNTVGGTAAGARNLIASSLFGVDIRGSRNVLAGNYIGTDASGFTSLANTTGVLISGSNNRVGGIQANEGNTISGNEIGLYNSGDGNVFQGNFVGTTPAGTFPLANRTGVQLTGSGNLLGGTFPGTRNVISGNADQGLAVGGTGNRVEGNFLGLSANGIVAVGNATGVSVDGNANTVGGTSPESRNVISGNRLNGVYLTGTDNSVLGNFIGTDSRGTVAVPNPTGVTFFGARGDTLGGAIPGARNVISGNLSAGVRISSAVGMQNQVQGNYIGLDASGTLPLGNGDTGLVIDGTVETTTIGGTVPGAANVISGHRLQGIWLPSGAQTVIEGNYVGTDARGTTALANGVGILVGNSSENTIGGTVAGARNVISGNLNEGVLATGPGFNSILGNYIGTDVTGNVALGNGVGMSVGGATVGGTTPGAGNVISGNRGDGLRIYGGVVRNNLIGTNRLGSAALGNGGNGISLAAVATVGGTVAGARNIISGNAHDGIALAGDRVRGTLIQGNLIGTDFSGTLALPNGGNGISSSGGASGNTIGGTAPGARNLISANGASGVLLAGAASSDYSILGNYIGTDSSGTAALANAVGLLIESGSNNTVGGSTPDARNLISGNRIYGLSITGSNPRGNRVLGNYIGTDVTGVSPLPNGLYGLLLAGGAENTVGGTVPGAGNLISGNLGSGLVVAARASLIQGNYIGTDAAGAVGLANGASGMVISGGQDNIVGGTVPGARNLVSGNRESGVDVSADRTAVLGNYIGTDISGTRSLANGMGVVLSGGADNTVGGADPGAGNLVSGNTGDGIAVGGGNSLVQGNLIGTDASAAAALPNGGAGVAVTGNANTIGGTADGAANLIAYNGHDGVLVDGGTGNAILRNRIFGHDSGLGIELVNGGNHSQEAPALAAASSDGSTLTVAGSLASAPNTVFTVEIFVNSACNPSGYGEGESFLASLTVATDAGGNASFSLTVAITLDPGQYVAATATDPGGNTSAFSACLAIDDGGALPKWRGEIAAPAGPGIGGDRRPVEMVPTLAVVSSRAAMGMWPDVAAGRDLFFADGATFARAEREADPGWHDGLGWLPDPGEPVVW